MYCSQCGKPVGDEAKFCVNCGTPVGYKEPEVVEQPIVVPVVSVPPVQMYEAPRKTSFVSAIVLSAVSAFLMFISFVIIIDEFATFGIATDTAQGCFVMCLLPAFIMSMIGYIRAVKAKNSQKTTASKVVCILSLICFIVATLFMVVIFVCMMTGAGEIPYTPDSNTDLFL